ncbi:MAG: FTR1 family protein [Bdellovibrio sp.]
MMNALIVVYRESFEALLIVGLLWSFLARQSASKKGYQALLLGTVGGLALSLVLGFFIHRAESEFEGLALEVFQLSMLVLAVELMTHMCIWMRKHARTLKSELEAGAREALTTGRFWSLTLLTIIAVGREGSETVIFLYGLWTESVESGQTGAFVGLALAGLGLGAATWYAFQHGFKAFTQKTYFTVSTFLLFITAGSLVIAIARKVIELGWVTIGTEAAWNSEGVLSDQNPVGSFLSLLTGYHTQPALFVVFAYVAYWAVVVTLYRQAGQVPRVTAHAS